MTDKFLLLTAAVLLFSAALRAEEASFSDGLIERELAVEAALAVTSDVYPNADTVVVDEQIRVEYEPDGTSVTWDDEYVKVLTEKGKRAQRALSFNYTLPYGTVEVARLDIVKPDGTVVPVDVAGQSRVMTDRSQMSSNIYNPNRKILNVSVPGLEIGDVCHVLSVRRTVKPRVPDTWSDYSVFEYTSPLKHIVYDVFGPKSLPLRRIALRDEVAGTVTHTTDDLGDRVRHRWEIRDVARMYREPRMPALYTVVQRLLVSTIPDWEAISRWYWELCKPHLDAVTPAMEQKVAALVEGAGSRRERIERIFQFVSQQVRYMGITTETEAPGYEPHDVKVTFENRYGVCRDKGALLVAMLRLADFPAYPVLIHAGPRKDEEVPQPYFNHAVAAVDEGGGSYLLMDPTDENTTELLPAYLGYKSYLVAHPRGESLQTSPVYPATNNLVRIVSGGRLNDVGTLIGESDIRFEGINDNAYRGYFSRLKPDERRRFFEGALKRRLAGAMLTDFVIRPADMQDTSQPLFVNLRYRVPDYLIGSGDYAMVPLPWLGTRIGYVNFVLGQTGLAERKYPLFSEITCGVEETFDLELGTSVRAAVATPDYQPLETENVTFVQSMNLSSNRVQGRGTFLLKTVEFSPRDYLALKDMLKDIEFMRRKKPVFEARPEGDDQDDIIVLSAHSDVTLADARTWTVRDTVRKKILTYAGKKANAELKLAYNPAWEKVALDSAVVTNPDGAVHTVSEEEINIMDAGWVGAAPRYPAGKTLVASLPGVEIGSVVEYRVTREQRDFPFFSLRTSFRGMDQVMTNRLTIACPESVALAVLDDTGDAVNASQRTANGVRSYAWTASSQEAVRKEDALPPWWSFNPTVFVSGGSWAAYAGEVRSVLAAAAAEADRARETARGILAGKANARERAIAVRDYVAKNVRRAGPNLVRLPLSAVTAADRTLADGYGNTTDHAVLLFAMLAEGELAPEFVLVSSSAPKLDGLTAPLRDCPQRGLFDAVLVRVKIDGAWIYLNDTDQYARLGATPHDGRAGLTLDGELIVVAALPGAEDRAEQSYRISLEETGRARVTFTRRYFGTGFGAFHRKFAELPPEERRRYYQERTAQLSQAAEAESDLVTDYGSYPGVEAFTVGIDRYAVRSGKYLYLALPGGLGDIFRLRADRRVNPLYRAEPMRSLTAYEIELPPATAGVLVVPADLSWDGPAGLGRVTVTQKETAGPEGRVIIEIRQETDMHPAVVPEENYAALLDIHRRTTHADMRTVLIELDRSGVSP